MTTPRPNSTKRRLIRVVHVIADLDVGGPDHSLLQLATHTDLDRFHLTFASLGQIGSIGDQLRQLGHPVFSMHRSEGIHPGLVGQLHRVFCNIRADVVHTHDAQALIYAAPAARIAGVHSIVHTQHGRNFGSSKRQEWLLCQAARMTRHFVCVSGEIAKLAIEIGVNPKKVNILHDAMEADLFRSNHHRRDRNFLVCATRLGPDSGVSTLIDAIALLVDRDPSIRVMIVGDGEFRDELQSQIDDHDLRDHISLVGEVDGLRDLIQQARVFVLPSDFDGPTSTLLEAMCAKVPIVATDAVDTADIIENDYNGSLVPLADPSAMADAIFHLWKDPDLCERYTEASFRIVTQRFSTEQMMRGYSTIYESNLPVSKRHESLASPNELETT